MTAQVQTSVSSTPPLSNLQLHLLKLFASGVSEEDLKAIQRMISRYFADKASAEARQVWDEKGFTAEQLLQENMRTFVQNAPQNAPVSDEEIVDILTEMRYGILPAIAQ